MTPSSTRAAARARTLIPALLGLLAAACVEATFAGTPAVLGIAATSDSVASDGVSSAVVSVQLPPSLPQDASVEFATTLGRWAIPGAAPDRKVTVRARGGTAKARLIASGEVGTATITAAVGTASAAITVELTPALPDSVDLFVDRVAAPADGATPVTATAILRRASGTVSKGIPVRFEVQDSATAAALPALGGVTVADSGGTARLRLTSAVVRTVVIRAVAATVASDPRTVQFTQPAAAVAGSPAARQQERGGTSPRESRKER